MNLTTLEAIESRRSIRRYKNKQVSDENSMPRKRLTNQDILL